jgi:hypothetical protein
MCEKGIHISARFWPQWKRAAVAAVCLVLPIVAQEPKEVPEPRLLSLFPAGGSPGQTVKAEIRGLWLSGARTVWFESGGLHASVERVETLSEQFPEALPGAPPPRVKPRPIDLVRIELRIPPAAEPGTRLLRLVTPRGLSTPVPFQVTAGPVIPEVAADHSTARTAQPISAPSIVFARIENRGEVDFYRVRAARDELLVFEVRGAQNFVPRLALFRRGGSWFDSERPARLLFEEERNSDLMFAKPLASFRAPEAGDYFVEVSSLFGKGGPDCTYQFRVSRGAPPAAEPAPLDWKERNFARSLNEDWIQSLVGRSVKGSPAAPAVIASAGAAGTGAAPADPGEAPAPAALSTNPQIVREEEAGSPVTLPAVFEGAIEHPGDLDSFHFKVEPGQKLTFEIETPATTTPHFNPRIGVVDLMDHEFFSNVDRRISLFNNNADPHVFLKAIAPRATFTFERGGEYILNVRDITSRYGDPGFRYRILVRQQVPHVGEIAVAGAEQINLRPGEARKLAITAQFEEGFSGDVAVTLKGLPPGVQAFPAVPYSDGRAPLEVPQNPDIVLPKEQRAAIVLLTAPDAPPTAEPALAVVYCRPTAGGKLGESLRVRAIPLMVIADEQKAEEAKP